MSEVMKARLKEICPDKKVSEMTSDELLKAVNVAFEVVGYEPIDIEEAMEYINNTSDAEMLSEYVYLVWEADQ